MKYVLLFMLSVSIQYGVHAQGNSGKTKSKDTPSSQSSNNGNGNSKDKVKSDNANKDQLNKDKAKNDEHDKKVWDGIGDNSCMKPSKNQPAKVTASFQRDFPGISNVRWTKCRGDWTATFNGVLFRSTAVYHANGDRKDTRTPILRDNMPRRVLDEILKRFPNSNVDGAVKIEAVGIANEIFRIKNILNGQAQFKYFNADGTEVTYNY